MFTLIFALVPILLVLAGIWWIVVSQKQAKQITISFPPRAAWFGIALLTGFHFGLYDTLSTQLFPSIGLMVFGITIAIGWGILFWKNWSPIIVCLLLAIVMSSLLMSWRASGFIQGVNVFIFLLANSVLYARILRGAGAQSLIRLVHDWLGAMLRSISQLIALVSWFKNEKSNDNQQKVVGWIKTICLALIGALVFIILLSQADPVFAQLVKTLQEQLLGRFFWTILIVIGLAVALSMRRQELDESYKLRWFSSRDAIVVVAAVSLVIGAFLVVQWQYLFGSSHELLDTLKISYSEYVRKGFVELLVATLIGGVLSYLLAIKLRAGKQTDNRYWLLLIGNVILITELFALLLSAYKRDLLYVDTYGLTRVRIIGEVFLVWLACLLIVLLVFAVWKKLRERSTVLILGAVTIVAWLGIQIVNVDAIIARGAPGHHDYTDYFYIMQLSEDAAREQLALLPDVITETKQLLTQSSLTDKERSQLAGLKLALLSFQEHADNLFFHFASESAIIAASDQYNQQWPNDRPWPHDYFTCENTQESSRYRGYDPYSCTKDNRQLSARLHTERSWRFFQPTRKQAYDLWNSKPELISSVAPLLADIKMYQKENKLTLSDQERRLLYDFSYPFLFVRLNYYYAGSDDYWENANQVDQIRQLQPTPAPTQLGEELPVADPTPLVKTIVLPTQEPKTLRLNLVTPTPME